MEAEVQDPDDTGRVETLSERRSTAETKTRKESDEVKQDDIGGGGQLSTQEEALLNEANELEKLQFQVPVELEASFTPAEIEQMKLLFEELDADESGSIDVEELQQAFKKMGEEVSQDELEDLIDEFDEDHNGAIEFPEFLHLLARYRKEDGKANQLTKLFQGLNETPLVMLERECARRKLRLQYKLLEVREPTSMHATQFIMVAQISGQFLESGEDGKIIRSEETRAYEGIGCNTRTAKFNAATKAIATLREHIPGIDFAPGEIPGNWLKWFADNIDRGVDEIELLQKLTVKGFYPCKNTLFMQKLSLRVSMLRMQHEDPGLWPAAEGRELPPEWIHWVQGHMKRGVHGKVILAILVENGFRPKRNPLLANLLRQDKGGAYSDNVRPQSMDFWTCASEGFLKELRRYMAAGQEVDLPKLIVGHETTALTLAIKHKQQEAVIYLLDQGAEINRRDKYGRRCTHTAAQTGSVDILKLLISRGADAVSPDQYGDTPLHVACGHGHKDLSNFLLDWYSERMRRVVSGRDGLSRGESFRAAAKHTHDSMIEARLSRFLTPRFKKVWMVAALKEFTLRAKGATFQPIAKTSASLQKKANNDPINQEDSVDNIIEFVEELDPKSGFQLYPPDTSLIYAAMNRFDFHPDRDFLEFEEFEYILARCMYGGWVNLKNSVGRTPLICTVDPSQGELSENHILIGTALINEHGAEIGLRDKNGRTVMEILEMKLKSFGGFFLHAVEEAKAEREREGKTMEVDLEPLVNDKLFKALTNSREVITHWRAVLSESSRLRQIDDYAEMVHERTKSLFYCNSNGQCQWSKPSCVLECDHVLHGWAQLKRRSKRIHTYQHWDVYMHEESGQIFYHDFESGESQWERPEKMDLKAPEHNKEGSSEITKLGFWQKWRYNDESRQVYYVHEKTGNCQFERPLEWSDYVDAINLSPESIQEDWQALHVSSEIRRSFNEWEECKDFMTLNIFYWNKKTLTGSWKRPMEVMEMEQASFLYDALRAREGGRARKRLQVTRQAKDEVTGIVWSEEVDNFRDGKNIVCICYYVGQDLKNKRTFAYSRVPPPFAEKSTELSSNSSSDPSSGALIDAKSHQSHRRPREGRRRSSFQAAEETTNTLAGNGRRRSSITERRRSSVGSATEALKAQAGFALGNTLQRMMLMIQAAEERMADGYVLCDWGCKDWIEPAEIEYHRSELCRRRQLACNLGCGLVLRAEEWDLARKVHETMECPKRMVPCDNRCGEMIRFDLMEGHLEKDCVKRPVPALPCKFNCGWKISGGLEDQDHMRWEARQHELHECALRQVRCDWLGCMAEMEARELPMHRQDHLHNLGITSWTTAGSYKWRVPRKCRSLLIHMWGGGGGAGILKGRRGGNGGGGAFVEAEVSVYPKEELIIVVGSGGETRDDEQPHDFYPEDDFQRVAKGGFPGGGDGISNNYTFACGGGGGYSAVLRQGAFGEELLLLAGGGGGAGTRNGNPGGDEKSDPVDFDGIRRLGAPGTQTKGGLAGEAPEDVLPAQNGKAYQGGSGAQFGGGGGGGLFGGGGGGFTPGVVGGGGGGSCFVNREVTKRHRVVCGVAHEPGGKEADIPASTGLGDWDAVGRFAGYGGCATKTTVEPGCAGAVRIRLPTHFATKVPERHLRLPDEEDHRLALAAAMQGPDESRSCITCDDDDEFAPHRYSLSSKRRASNQEEDLEAHMASVSGVGSSHSRLSGNQDSDEEDSAKSDEDKDSTMEDGDDDDDDDNELPEELQVKETDPYDTFVAGTRIQCRYQGKSYNPWYAGVIADVNTDGTFDIQYDDGDMDYSMPLEMIRLELVYGMAP